MKSTCLATALGRQRSEQQGRYRRATSSEDHKVSINIRNYSGGLEGRI
jgi:hypothetical protein